MDIGNTGNISCYFRGISPVVKKQEKDSKYYFISLTLEEVKNVPPSDEGNGHTCHQCGLH